MAHFIPRTVLFIKPLSFITCFILVTFSLFFMPVDICNSASIATILCDVTSGCLFDVVTAAFPRGLNLEIPFQIKVRDIITIMIYQRQGNLKAYPWQGYGCPAMTWGAIAAIM